MRVAATPAIPSAGSTFTEFRRPTTVLFLRFAFLLSMRCFSKLEPDYFRLAETVDGHDIDVVVFAWRNGWEILAAQGRSNLRHTVVVTGNKDRLPAQAG